MVKYNNPHDDLVETELDNMRKVDRKGNSGVITAEEIISPNSKIASSIPGKPFILNANAVIASSDVMISSSHLTDNCDHIRALIIAFELPPGSNT
jgi:hypothetical protein